MKSSVGKIEIRTGKYNIKALPQREIKKKIALNLRGSGSGLLMQAMLSDRTMLRLDETRK